MRFEKMEDCYLDTATGLEWSLENYGPMDWHKAMKFCDGLGNNWRPPAIKDLLTLVDHTRYRPATELPHMMPSYYWSSTTHADSTDCAWGVYFYYGSDGWSSKSYGYYVRAVRGGRGLMEDYAIALQQAIEYAVQGIEIPELIAKKCPHHAQLLNKMLQRGPCND